MKTCYYAGSERPRLMIGRHLVEGCECKGCEPCAHSHCDICTLAHAAGVCPECMAETREDLREIGRLCDALPAEVEHRGVDGEAMMLLGPAADPEARGHLKASINVGRVPADYLEEADDEKHPLFVLATWAMLWRDLLEHDEPTDRVSVPSELDYLDRQMTYMSGRDEMPFSDFARDLRECRTHVEKVLHADEQIDRGAPCMTCEKPLVKVYEFDELPWTHRDGSKPFADYDGWACTRCKDWRSEQDYRLNVAEQHRTNADYLNAADMVAETGVKPGSLTGWASAGKVKKRLAGGRVVYKVADVLAQLDTDDDGKMSA